MSQEKDTVSSEKPHDIADFFNLSAQKCTDAPVLRFTDDSLKRTRTIGLAGVTLTCSFISLLVKVIEQSTVFLYPLLATFFLGLVSCSVLWCKKGYETLISTILWILLTLLGFYIIVFDPTPDHRYLLWINMFPLTCIFTMGLYRGALLFSFFIFVLLMLFYTPLQVYMQNPIDFGVQLRLFASMIGCFAVVVCVEYARVKTYKALQNAVMYIGKTSLTDTLTGL